MKKMIKLVAGAVTFGVLSGSVFTGTEYALNRVTGSGITQTQSSKTGCDNDKTVGRQYERYYTDFGFYIR